MRNKSGIKSVVFIYIIFAVLLIGAVFGLAVYTTHISTVVRPDGQSSSADWVQQYAESFGEHITVSNGTVQIGDDTKAYLNRNELWVQVLDTNAKEVFAHNKPAGIPSEYTLSELLSISASSAFGEYTVFAMPLNDDFEYIVACKTNVSKVTMYFNSERYGGGKSIAFAVLLSVCVFVLLLGVVYGAWLTSHVSKIMKSSTEIAARKYEPKKQSGVFADAHKSLNQLNYEIQASDAANIQTNRMREEWIVNITHDLKTPLSPIKGYAELLLDETYTVSKDETKKYASSILKNAVYTEQLINDLKLAYQIESGTIPVNMQVVDLKREIKEIIISLLNNPEYDGRSVHYKCDDNQVLANVDKTLFKRAISNIVINALVHNPPETEVNITVKTGDDVAVCVSDNGKGLTAHEAKNLFTRYYRGANTDEKAEGSGLGLAIVKQIVELHGGSAEVQSEPNKGTSITLHLQKNIK